MKNLIPSVKGTVDFYPEEMALRNWLYERIRAVSESFGYEEYEAPILETLELYAAKSGEELVKQQAFVFEDRSGKQIALRPELTPSLARMIAQRQGQLSFPLRWWSYGPFWRYERPQKGRTREFFQWNIDLIGVGTPQADAEIAAVGATLLQRVGLLPEEVRIRVNNRALMDQELARIGLSEQAREGASRLIDRRDKMSPERWRTFAMDLGLTPGQFDALKELLSDRELWKKSAELVRFFETIEALGRGAYFEYDPQIVRGLDYYTGTVFEAWDTSGEFRAIFGGGRYDSLVADVGGDRLPATGFAMGDKVLTALLEQRGRLPAAAELRKPLALVTVFNEQTQTESYRIAAELRASGLAVAIYPEAARLGKQFKYADRIGAQVAVVAGPDELARGEVAVKNLASGSQENVARDQAAWEIAALLKG